MARNFLGGRACLWRAVAPVALILLAVGLPSAGFAVADVRDSHRDSVSNFDLRAGKLSPTAAQRATVKHLRASATWNRFGTPSTLIRHRGSLARVQGRSAAEAARRWFAANSTLFRLSSVAGLRLGPTAPLGRRGRAVTFRQVADGTPFLNDGLVTVALRRGKAAGSWNVIFVSSSLTPNLRVAGRSAIGADQAWLRAARSVGHKVSDILRLRTASSGWTFMQADGLSGLQSIRPGVLPTARGGLVPAYETVVRDEVAGELKSYRLIVDARSGRVLLRESTVDHAVDNPRWKVFPAYPRIGINRYPWNYPSTDIRDIWCWTPGPACELAVSTGSPHPNVPWDTIPPGGPTFTTTGNNNIARERWGNPPGTPDGTPVPTYQPTSPTRDYVYPWTNVWYETKCDPANFVRGSGNDIDAATANLFAMHNRMHDWTFHLGFDEEHWNAQTAPGGLTRQPWNPAGLPTIHGDPLIGNAQAAAISGGFPTYPGRDNANMSTQPDGTNSTTNMFLWQALSGAFYAPCVDGDYDMSVIGHEFGHMVENRMIGKGARRMGHHAGAMGESFADLHAQEYLNEYGYIPVSGENPFAVGPYVTSNKYRGIRNYGMNFPYSGDNPRPSRYPFVNPLNFSDIGYDFVGAQVHADGEIWSATNFDIRRLLLAKYGSGGRTRQEECADGKRPPQECPGNRRWIQLYYDAMVLMPVAPSMIDARNAILAADIVRFGGANQNELWYAFGTRGFGESAAAASGADVQPKPAFDSPRHSEATVRFRAFARDEGNAPINANVYVGHYEARVSPIADTNPATGPADGSQPVDASNLDNVASFTSRLYEFTASAPGYGFVRFRTSFRPGETRTIDLYFATNWASRHKGAVATGDGTRQPDLIDDTERSNWHAGGAPVQGRQVTVQLAGGSHKLDRAQVSAYLTLENEGVPEMPPNPPTPGTQNRFTALRQFELWGCSANAANGMCAGLDNAGWSRIYRSAEDFFPSDAPRPVAPEINLRGFDLPSGKRATHVRLVVLHNQCTGNTAFHNDQDNDPGMNSDCRTGSPPAFPPRGNDVRAAELQLYSNEHRVRGASLVDDGDGDDDDDDDDDDGGDDDD
jgi:extracellular elastinolytic metalloproteinase